MFYQFFSRYLDLKCQTKYKAPQKQYGQSFVLLLIKKPILLYRKGNIDQHICIHEYIKAGKYLK